MRARRASALRTVVWLTVALPALSGACSETPQEAGPSTTEARLSPDALPVLVAAAPIEAGTPAEGAYAEGLLVDETRPRSAYPRDTIISMVLIEGKVAAEPIAPGTIITGGLFVDP